MQVGGDPLGWKGSPFYLWILPVILGLNSHHGLARLALDYLGMEPQRKAKLQVLGAGGLNGSLNISQHSIRDLDSLDLLFFGILAQDQDTP